MTASQLPRLVLKPRRAGPFFNRHPWVFAGAIDRVEGDPVAGDVVDVISNTGNFVARGLYNPVSRIRARLYSWNEEQPLDDDFWRSRIEQAVALRQRLFHGGPAERACRMVFSEADGLSGMTADRYGDYLLLQWTSFALAQRQAVILEALKSTLNPKGIWLRTEKGIGEMEGLEIRDGLLDGEAPPRPILIEENGLQFAVDVVEGQKTGYFFDQRDNRRAAAAYAHNASVLDMFCYSGGFGIAAAALGGAREVLCVDSSQSALNLATSNAERNGVSDRMRFENSNAYRKLEELQQQGTKFDLVILDPPKMARNQNGVEKAVRGYFSLNRLAVDLLPPGGILVTCSCSGLVGRGEFEDMLRQVGMQSKRGLQILEARIQSPDHPVSPYCDESLYLKCYICRVL
ncbi:MAG TPA: class I SAM-dependent rRNA methyltransferase [Caulifigura sp.]|nr:class I SAM-dependent rRNA methyltransferase [Caulifigura sp.]